MYWHSYDNMSRAISRIDNWHNDADARERTYRTRGGACILLLLAGALHPPQTGTDAALRYHHQIHNHISLGTEPLISHPHLTKYTSLTPPSLHRHSYCKSIVEAKHPPANTCTRASPWTLRTPSLIGFRLADVHKSCVADPETINFHHIPLYNHVIAI